MTKEEAVHAVVVYQTLPSQIDYQKPYYDKAMKALTFIDTLPPKEKEEALDAIEEAVNEYNKPIPNMGGYSAADLAEMF